MKTQEFRIFAVLLVGLLAGTQALLAYNTLYTEGEVMQGLYSVLVWANLPLAALALWKPRIGVWAAWGLGALLIPWQAFENRKWAQIHEEVVAIIRHVDAQKKSSGEYPAELGPYQFQRRWVGDHISYEPKQGAYRLRYFIDHPGISYWYDSDGGFGYYPD